MIVKKCTIMALKHIGWIWIPLLAMVVLMVIIYIYASYRGHGYGATEAKFMIASVCKHGH